MAILIPARAPSSLAFLMMYSGFRKGRGSRDQIANIRWIIGKAKEGGFCPPGGGERVCCLRPPSLCRRLLVCLSASSASPTSPCPDVRGQMSCLGDCRNRGSTRGRRLQSTGVLRTQAFAVHNILGEGSKLCANEEATLGNGRLYHHVLSRRGWMKIFHWESLDVMIKFRLEVPSKISFTLEILEPSKETIS